MQPYRYHLKNSDDLVVTYEAIRAGFLSLVLEKNRRAAPYVAQARALKVEASKVANAAALKNIAALRPALITAAGISGKAATHISSTDLDEAIKELVSKYLEPAGPAFVEELVFRFLLTCGDTLGGSMRNFGGAIAKRKLARSIMAALSLKKIPFYWLHSKNKKWALVKGDDTDLELNMKGISWSVDQHERTVIFDIVVPLVDKNVDLCLFDCSYSVAADAVRQPERYIALGELKGGVDPAGADEHWKTAGSALKRIRDAFDMQGLHPHTFFIGAAIAIAMAGEIWADLEGGMLSNAANFTKEEQVASVCSWLVTL
ncbi:MAG: type II restriction endonuclease [Chloroflexi bacterium]|nr:type II restriction endonuclease [Chloroflexota bacterium]